jgi:hypothetical protein
MKKPLIVIIAIVVVGALLAVWKFSDTASWSNTAEEQSPPDETVSGSFPVLEDTTASINKDVNSIDVGEFGTEFNSLDGDINSFGGSKI